MKLVARALYNQPVVFLAVVQAIATGLAGAKVIAAWIPAITLLVVTVLQRQLVRPNRPVR